MRAKESRSTVPPIDLEPAALAVTGLLDGAVHRNAQLLTVRHGQVVAAQVFFGGKYDQELTP
jgi:hypothetical protein